jgi:hypothetical protein
MQYGGEDGRSSDGKYLYVGIFNITGLMIRKLLHLLEIITISDANIVGANGLKAGTQVWPKKINRRLGNVKPE